MIPWGIHRNGQVAPRSLWTSSNIKIHTCYWLQKNFEWIDIFKMYDNDVSILFLSCHHKFNQMHVYSYPLVSAKLKFFAGKVIILYNWILIIDAWDFVHQRSFIITILWAVISNVQNWKVISSFSLQSRNTKLFMIFRFSFYKTVVRFSWNNPKK